MTFWYLVTIKLFLKESQVYVQEDSNILVMKLEFGIIHSFSAV